MSEELKRESEVFKQDLSMEELDAIAGAADPPDPSKPDVDRDNCYRGERRNIYGGNGFPNCAATVEEGSLCGTNDACVSFAIKYTNMCGIRGSDNCMKAWH